MVMVWKRYDCPGHGARFHKSPDCRQLTKKPARGEPHRLISMELDEVENQPCRTCYPDVPRLKILRRYCRVCESDSACEHNGGIYVRTIDGERIWAWPDSPRMALFRKQLKSNPLT